MLIVFLYVFFITLLCLVVCLFVVLFVVAVGIVVFVFVLLLCLFAFGSMESPEDGNFEKIFIKNLLMQYCLLNEEPDFIFIAYLL